MYRPESLIATNLGTFETLQYNFTTGKALLVVGDNKDDAGQKGNGSGKSMLLEAVVLAITGAPIRDVKMREMIRNEDGVLNIQLTLSNTVNSEKMTIGRTFYSQTSKSAECMISINNEIVKTCPDINSYNKFILDRIGITREDFFNFFIVTRRYYEPFFSIGDTKKKQIINRFSGADAVDKVEPFIKEDSDRLQAVLNSLETAIISNNSKQELLTEQLKQEQLRLDDVTIKTKVDEIQAKIAELEVSYTEKEASRLELVNWFAQRKIDQVALESEKPDVDGLILVEDNKIATLTQTRERKYLESKNVPNEFKAEIDSIKAIETECNTGIEELNLSISSTTKHIEHLKNQLAGAISCPKCSHEFTLRYKDFDVEAEKKNLIKLEADLEDLKATLQGYKDILAEQEPEKTKINDKVIARRKTIDDDVVKISNNIQLVEAYKAELRKTELDYLVKVKNFNAETNKQEYVFRQLEQWIDTVLANKQKALDEITKLQIKDESKVKDLTAQIEKYKIDGANYKGEKELVIVQKQYVDEWFINFKNFKSYLANQSIANITDYTNLFLQSIGSNISIKVEGYKMLSTKKLKEEITVTVFKDGIQFGSYGKFSAGEQGRVEFCCILALQELINLNAGIGKGLDLLMIDEILDAVDILGLELLVQAAQGLEKTIFIISQHEINTLASNTIIVRKENRLSQLFLS